LFPAGLSRQEPVTERSNEREKIMTTLLENALREVYKLPPEKQDGIATVIFEELEDEKKRESSFTASQEKLSELARKVREDIKAGHVKKMGFDKL